MSDTAFVRITVLDGMAPAPVANFTRRHGASSVILSWNGVAGDVVAVELWRALWRDADGNSAYPLYDDAPGNLPPQRPASRSATVADTLWSLVATLAAADSSFVDSPEVRGVYHYEVFARDLASNWSPRAETELRATDYRLGDCVAPGGGLVDDDDVAALAASYGAALGEPTFGPETDIGPTDDGTADGIPMTDGRTDFEDVMVIAINYGESVSSPNPSGGVELTWHHEGPATWSLWLSQPNPSCKGLRVRLALPAEITADVLPGALLADQVAPVFLRNNAPDSLDIALALLGGGRGLAGQGELLRLVLSAEGDPRGAEITARAIDNSPLPCTILDDVSDAVETDNHAPVFALGRNYPNPFYPSTTIRFSLPDASRAQLTIFDLRGRRIATLVNGEVAAGAHAVTWTGRDDEGAATASGVYLYRLTTNTGVATGRLTLLK